MTPCTKGTLSLSTELILHKSKLAIFEIGVFTKLATPPISFNNLLNALMHTNVFVYVWPNA